MRYFTCAALLALLTAFGCDQSTGSSVVVVSSSIPTTLTITTTTIPAFTVPGIPGPMPSYSATISATGGTGPYSWNLIAGTLPAGLNLNPTGTPSTTLAGTMTAPSTTSFTVEVTDANAATATMAYTLVVYYAPTPPPSGPPVYYSQPVAGRVLFICDISSAASGTAHWDMIHELNNAIGGLSATDEFDLLIYHDTVQGGYEALAGTLVPATSTNITAALLFVNSTVMTPSGSADLGAYTSLEASFQSYTNVDVSYFFSCSTPASASQILSDYPTWHANDPNRQQIVICKSQSAAGWCQQLAAVAGGTYIP